MANLKERLEPPRVNLTEEVRKFEARLIRMALEHTGGRRADAARLLGLSYSTFRDKLLLLTGQPT